MEQNGAGDKVLEAIKPWRDSFAVVKRELQAHGMPLSEDIEVEGPTMGHTTSGIPVVVAWPTGVWVRFIWPDQSRISFRGHDAQVAVTFWIWWADFQDVHMKQMDIAKDAQAKTRIILPGSAESQAYHDAKRKDLRQ